MPEEDQIMTIIQPLTSCLKTVIKSNLNSAGVLMHGDCNHQLKLNDTLL